MIKRFSFAVLLCFLLHNVYSQQTELDPVTVTATLNPVSLSATGRNILVIKGEQFAKLPANSIDELLRYLPGIEVQMRGPMGSQSDLVLRGGTFQQVLVVLDGIRLNDPNTGHFSSYIPIAPSEIDRIEILKGASSAIYGSEAVGGVIQVITKTFAAKKEQRSKQLTLQGSVGEYGLWNAQVGGYIKTANTAVASGIITNNANGQPQRGSKGYFNNNTASLSVNHFLNDKWNIGLRTAYDSRDFAAQNFYTTFASDTATEKVTSLWNHFKLNYTGNKNRFSFDAGYKSLNDFYLYNPRSIPNENKSDLMQAVAVYSWNASTKTSITTGANFINKKIKSNDRGNHSLNHAAAFAILNQTIGEHFYLNPAMRLQWNERTGWEVVPQLNVSYKIPKWQLRASAGKTTREADFTERFNNYGKLLVTGGSVGNPDLTPERSFSLEGGADFFGLRNLRISSSIFHRNFDDLIDFVPTPYSQMPRKQNLAAAGTFALAKNISRLQSTGFETDIQFNKKISTDEQLWFTTGFTFIDTKSDEANPSFYILSHAKILANFSFQYSKNWFAVSTNGLYKSRRPFTTAPINAKVEKSYFVMNLQLQAFVYQRKLSLFAQVDNMFNKTYSDLLGSQMPGRWLMAGFKGIF